MGLIRFRLGESPPPMLPLSGWAAASRSAAPRHQVPPQLLHCRALAGCHIASSPLLLCCHACRRATSSWFASSRGQRRWRTASEADWLGVCAVRVVEWSRREEGTGGEGAGTHAAAPARPADTPLRPCGRTGARGLWARVVVDRHVHACHGALALIHGDLTVLALRTCHKWMSWAARAPPPRTHVALLSHGTHVSAALPCTPNQPAVPFSTPLRHRRLAVQQRPCATSILPTMPPLRVTRTRNPRSET